MIEKYATIFKPNGKDSHLINDIKIFISMFMLVILFVIFNSFRIKRNVETILINNPWFKLILIYFLCMFTFATCSYRFTTRDLILSFIITVIVYLLIE